MADTKINVDLSPESVIKALHDMGEETKKLAQAIEESLGKKSVQNVAKLEEAAEKGSTQIGTFFRNMASRLKEDLRTAFDATGIIGGAKLAREIGEGVRSVFEMEKAFDRLNTRLQLTGRSFLDFKKNVGTAVAATGQRLEDILPGVERISARGNVTNPQQLQQMAGMLAQVRATTGEEVSGLADTITDILKDQQKQVNTQNVQAVMDTLQAARTRGSFQTAGEAGAAVRAISPYAKQLGLGTQELGGLAAIASRAGQGGQNILQQLMQRATTPGGQEQLNAVLGQRIFNRGRLDVGALGRVNVNRFGQYSQQAMAEATGLQGASGADLARFVDAFKNGMGKFGEVTHSFGETQRQFDTATDNFATSVQKFKQRTIEASREIGSGLSAAANALLKGDFKGAREAISSAGASAYENKGTLAGAGALSLGAGLLMGGGINSLLKRLPGVGGVAGRVGGSLAGGALAEATGVQKVYVVNASEIGQGIGDIAGLGGKLTGAGGILGGGAGLAGAAGALGTAGLAVGGGLALGQGAQYIGSGQMEEDVTRWFKDLFGKKEEGSKIGQIPMPAIAGETAVSFNPGGIEQAIERGASKATIKMQGHYTNPSSVQSRGGSF